MARSTTSACSTITSRTSPARAPSSSPSTRCRVERAAEYAAEDADVTLRLHRALWPQLEAVPALARLYEEIEQPLVPVLQRMEHRGVLIDREHAARAEPRDRARSCRSCVAQAHREAGARLQPRVAEAAAADPVREAAAAGAAQDADRPALDRRGRAGGAGRELRAAAHHPRLPRARQAAIHLHRQAAGADQRATPGACTPPITRRWPPPGGCPRPIRTCRTFRSAAPKGGASARRSSRRPGYVLLAADYSQIELRIMAHLSGDEGLLRAFAEDRDVHQATAAEVFGVAARRGDRRPAPLRQGDQLRPDLRHVAVRAGAPARHRARRGAAVRRALFRSAIRACGASWTTRASRRARRRLRRDRVRAAAVSARHPLRATAQLQQYAERSAINAPMQGTAADIIKRAMIAVDAWCRRERCPGAADHAGARRAGARGARGLRSRQSTRAVRERMMGAADAAGAAASRRRRGRQLGRGALKASQASP